MIKYRNFSASMLIFLMISSPCFASHSTESLKAAGEKYLDFLNQFGQSDNSNASKQLPLIMAPHCQKIINGKVATKDIAELKAQLQDVHKMVGTWTLESLDVLPSPHDDCCVVRYVLKSSQKGNFTTIAILKYDSKSRIAQINEVWNKFEG